MIIEAIVSLVSMSLLLVISQLSPGPDVIFVFRTALAQGWRAGTMAGLGISLGFAGHIIMICLIGLWLVEQPWSHYVLVAAALWLLYLVYKIVSSQSLQGEDMVGSAMRRDSDGSIFVQGFLCNILNIKCTLFLAGVTLVPLQQFSDLPWYRVAVVLSLTLFGAGGWAMWSGLLQWRPLRACYLRHLRLVDTVFAGLLGLFALTLLATALGFLTF